MKPEELKKADIDRMLRELDSVDLDAPVLKKWQKELPEARTRVNYMTREALPAAYLGIGEEVDRRPAFQVKLENRLRRVYRTFQHTENIIYQTSKVNEWMNMLIREQCHATLKHHVKTTTGEKFSSRPDKVFAWSWKPVLKHGNVLSRIGVVVPDPAPVLYRDNIPLDYYSRWAVELNVGFFINEAYSKPVPVEVVNRMGELHVALVKAGIRHRFAITDIDKVEVEKQRHSSIYTAKKGQAHVPGPKKADPFVAVFVQGFERYPLVFAHWDEPGFRLVGDE